MQDIQDFANGDYVSGDGDIDRGENVESMAEEMFGKFDGLQALRLSVCLLGPQIITIVRNAQLTGLLAVLGTHLGRIAGSGLHDIVKLRLRVLDRVRILGFPGLVQFLSRRQGVVFIFVIQLGLLLVRQALHAERIIETVGALTEHLLSHAHYLRAQKADAEAQGLKPIEGADIPDEPEKELTSDGQMAYEAARDGDAETLRSAAGIYDANGLTEEQREELNDMIADGATEGQIADRVEEMAEENFGENHAAVVDKMNEAAGRSGGALYGSSDNSGVDTIHDSLVIVAQIGAGILVHLRRDIRRALAGIPSKDLSAGNQAIFEAARDGNTAALQQAAHSVNAHGLTADQSSAVQSMISTGASEAEVAAAIDNFAQDNFGNDYKQVVDSINDAAGRDGTVTYSAPTGGGEDGMQPRSMEVGSGFVNGQAAYSVDDLSTDGPGHMVTVSDENGQSVYQDTTPGAGGEQVVTSDFGQFDGQTYGSIRNEVDAVANASGGMLQRGSGAGDFGKTTVSEAASEIASRQSQAVSGGRASAKVGSSVMGAGTGDLNAFNAASREAVKTTGLEAGDVAGIAGGVDSHGMATTTLPAAPPIPAFPPLSGDIPGAAISTPRFWAIAA